MVWQAAHEDDQEVDLFRQEFVSFVQKMTQLPSNVQSDVILNLKEQADQLYEKAKGLRKAEEDELQAELNGLIKLIAVLMKKVWEGASGDPSALSKLEEEEAARAMHFELLELPLVCDLLRTDSVIAEGELTPSLLCCNSEEMVKTLRIFDAQQLQNILQEAHTLNEGLDNQRAEEIDTQSKIAAIEAAINKYPA